MKFASLLSRSGRKSHRKWRRQAFRFLLFVVGTGLAVPAVIVLCLRWVPPPTSAFMVMHHFERLTSSQEVPPVRYTWVSRDQISPYMALAVLASEDQRFPEHRGFDFIAIRQAMEQNTRSTRLRGASTLSQQTAKNLFLWGGRSYLRKGIEAWLTLYLELLWPKGRILEVYLNIAEFGNGIYGVHAASAHFFNKKPDQLTRREAALLAAVLPSPRRLHADRPSSYLQSRVRWIQTNMNRLGGTRFVDRIWAQPGHG
ncbi:monofunctional biosynthetic peptidoglycan transglycosylase [Desulfobulbus alkaliphilus]|uniref:monofunctional biosynthetic peptidoglycan transglycosylase n=1 Tax=Desulfobulbus alkaliphilus TaxID=869814 RepID=UPI001964E5A7|nr:monofunctional biosynthetic peptidoglycan transglycosylase [Desulfobulbus alkaliphilus]